MSQDPYPLDPFNLDRFIAAQETGGAYPRALRELRGGRKRTHWMWFIFPQVAVLGRSAMAQRFAISGLPEAAAYLAEPVLRRRLIECAQALTALPGTDAAAVLGTIDALKLRSSMTLFARAAGAPPVFADVLDQYFAGEQDPATIALLRPAPVTDPRAD
jgi:uncharacterized protein (DUF1810 family)